MDALANVRSGVKSLKLVLTADMVPMQLTTVGEDSGKEAIDEIDHVANITSTYGESPLSVCCCS